MSNNLKIVKISDLPQSTSVDSTYFFGYDADPNKSLSEQSVKIPFSAVAKASTERRIAIVMETDTQIIPIGEKMKIIKNVCKNVDTLEIRQNNSSTMTGIIIRPNTNDSADLSSYVENDTDALIKITRSGTDPIATVYLFTKVIQ